MYKEIHSVPVLDLSGLCPIIWIVIYPNNLKLPFLVYDFWPFFEPKISKVKQLPVVIFGIKNHLKLHA